MNSEGRRLNRVSGRTQINGRANLHQDDCTTAAMMSGRLVGEVLRCAPADLTLAERMVLVCLAEAARDTDRVARKTSAKIISDYAGVSLGTVKNALSSLAQRALIQPLHRAYVGFSQDYRLTPLSEHHRASQRTPKDHSTVTLNGSRGSRSSDALSVERVSPQ